MLLLTVASQMEILAIGIITRKFSGGSAFFDSIVNTLNEYIHITDNLVNLACFLLFVAFFKAITMFIQRYSNKLIAIRVSRDLRQDYFEHIQRLPMRFYQHQSTGSLSTRVLGDAALISEAINACLTNYIQTPFTVLSTLTICFLASWQLTLMVFIGFPLILVPIALLSKKVKKISRQIQQNQETFASVLIDFIAGIQTVKVFAMESFSRNKYAEQNRAMAGLEEKSARYDLSTRPVVHTLGMFFLAATMMFGLYGLQMEVSDILVYCGMLYLFYEPIKKFAEENTHIQRGVSAAERLLEIMKIEVNAEENLLPPLPHFEKEIEFKDVWFRYQDAWVLKGVSFKIRKGETVAIVGPTGAGKSTIVQLLPRLFDVERGEVLIDGQPITQFNPKSLREAIAFIPQKPFLFLDTVEANIAFGRPFDKEQIVDAAKKAHADEFIQKLPGSYDMMLSESGKNLSGGQQQRLAIARALVKNAPILVMDEATSSLDSVSENYIKLAIRELRGTMTQVIIAHRLTTIEDADQIIFMDHGKIVSQGTHQELIQSCPPFKLMWDMLQMGASK
jgi:ABC-type multidrug transport system fused ATPase/permease subunit